MTPTRAQLFYARNGPLRLWFVIVPLVLGVALARTFGVTLRMLNEPRSLGVTALSFTLALLVTAATGWFVLGPLYYARGITNGAPYKVGDEVLVLVGRQRGQVVRVAEVREARDQVRVEGGELYGHIQVCRVKPPLS